MTYPHDFGFGPEGDAVLACTRCHRLSWHAHIHEECPALLRARVDELEADRAAVVAWLRSGMGDPGRSSAAFEESVGAVAREIADGIEAGKHREDQPTPTPTTPHKQENP